MVDKQTLESRLSPFGQTHLLAHWDRLDAAGKGRLAEQLLELDLNLLARLRAGGDDQPDWSALAAVAEPPPAIRLPAAAGERPRGTGGLGDVPSADAARQRGAQRLRQGRVAAILVAGGQGTRLGFDAPKGLFPLGPLSGRTLFQMHIDRLQGLKRRFGCELPLWVMTSPATDVATREFFREQDDFGLGSDELVFFCQGTMPAVSDTDGRILMSAADSLALSPDGHGGMLAALLKSGLLETATERGIDHLYYAQVDNPLITLGDPDLIGYHSCLNSQLTTQVVRKRFATEKVGNVVAIDGRTQIIEYSDLPESAAQQTLADGSLKLWAGNIAVHVFDTDFLKQVASSAESLPFHRAHKAVSFFDASGSVVEAKQPNAIKFERFIFDLLPLAERTLVVEGDAAEVFAPVKNADGAAVDTPTTARQALLALHRRWLCEAGVEVSQEVAVEIHPGWAWDAQEVAERVEPPLQIVADTYLT